MNSEEGRDGEDVFGRKWYGAGWVLFSSMGGMCVALELWSFETDNIPVPVANKLPEQQIADASMAFVMAKAKAHEQISHLNWEAQLAAATIILHLIHRQIFCQS